MNDTISVIIPVYNVEAFIIPCLRSVANQTYLGAIECLIIDDRGSDTSMEKVQNFISSYKGNVNFKILTHEKNSGLSAARNTGLDNATGDFVYFLDSDDFIDKDALEVLHNAITEEYGIAISYFLEYKNGRDSIYRKKWVFDTPRVIQPEDFAYNMLSEKSNYASTAKLYRRELLKGVRFRLGKKNEDTLYILDLMKAIEDQKKKCIDIPYYGYHYRIVQGSISHNASRPLAIDVIENYDTVIQECSHHSKVIEWVQAKQIELILALLYGIVQGTVFDEGKYKRFASKLKTYDRSFVKEHLNTGNYRNYLKIIRHPSFYKFIHSGISNMRKLLLGGGKISRL